MPSRQPVPKVEASTAPSTDRLLEELLEAWAINNRINLLLLDHVTDEGMGATLSTRGGRDVSRQLAHMHMVRIGWLENGKGRDLAEGIVRFDPKDQPSRAQLRTAFQTSGDAIQRYMGDLGTGRRVSSSVKKGLGGFFGYLIAHEAHHRGSILLTLKQCGHKLDESLKWGIWAWDKL